MYLIVAITGYLGLAVVSILDKFIVSEKKVSPLRFTFYTTAPLLAVFLLLPIGVTFLKIPDYLTALISGISFGFAMWTMYIGFKESEVSHIGPLIGAAVPLFTLALAQIFLKEIINSRQAIAIGILIIGSLLISFEKSKLHSGWHRGMLWGALSGLLFAVSNVSAKLIYNAYGFYSGLVWTRGAIGIFGLLLLLVPKFYGELFVKKPLSAQASAVKSKFIYWFIIIFDKLLGIAGVVLIQYAIARGSVTIVNALGGVEYAALIVLVAALSKYFGKLFREDYGRGEIVQETISVALISLGMALLIL